MLRNAVMLALCFSFSSQVLAQAKIVDKQDVVKKTKDGREYAKLTEKEVDELSDEDFDKYNKWKIAQKNAKIIALDEGIKTKKEEVIAKKEEVIALDEGIGAKKKIIESLAVTEKILDNKIAELNSQITVSRLEM
jgi:hypothetical protein